MWRINLINPQRQVNEGGVLICYPAYGILSEYVCNLRIFMLELILISFLNNRHDEYRGPL